jgi:lipoprotein-anchoring transpeptidase ErfK/SrfK
MSRSSHSFMLRSGLVIATMLAIVPASLIAETTPAQGQDPSPQTATSQPNATSNSAKGTGSTEQPGTKSKAGAPAASATGTTSTAKSGTPTAPATPATAATSTKPATESAATTIKPGNPLAPATAATSTKPASGSTAPTAKPGTAAVTATGSSPTTGNGIDSKKAPASAVSTNSPPVMETVSLVLNLKEKHVYVYKGDKVLTKYPVAIGKKGWETPLGEWQVMEKVVNPGWTSFKDGSVMRPGKDNPLGERWIGFWTDGKDVIGFHGTPNVKSIGTAASHGCVRMLNRDVKALFPLVKVGTTVKVVAQ